MATRKKSSTVELITDEVVKTTTEDIKKEITLKCTNKYLTVWRKGVYAQFINGYFKTDDRALADFILKEFKHLITEVE